MTFWRTFHSISEDLACSLGFSLNLLLLVVIKKIKVKWMQKYSILLFQCCCIDLIQVVISFIVKPVTITHQKNAYFLSNGYLRDIGGWVEMLGIVLWSTSVLFCICSMPVSYIFRYRTLCLNATISKRFYIVSLAVAIFSASTFGMSVWKFQYLDNQNLTYLADLNLAWLMADDEGKVKAASIGLTGTFGMWFCIIDAGLVTFIPYVIIVICNVKIMKYLRCHRHSLSTACRRTHSDLNRILWAQAIIPLFSAFFPMMIQILSVVTDIDLVFESFICGILYSWIPVGNAISVLCFITAYRKKFKQFMSCPSPWLLQMLLKSSTETSNL